MSHYAFYFLYLQFLKQNEDKWDFKFIKFSIIFFIAVYVLIQVLSTKYVFYELLI